MVFLAEVGRCAEDVEMSYLVGVDVSVVSTAENSTRVVGTTAVPSLDADALLAVDAPAPSQPAVHAPTRERAA